MALISVVIICKNEADNISVCLQSVQRITNDIVVYDNGSTDGTQDVVRRYDARLVQAAWEGFGTTKQKATALAKYDWILNLDADEALDETLVNALQKILLDDENVVYEMQFKNFLGDTYLRYGEWGGDKHIRLFNRQKVNWNDAPVHESLVLPAAIKKIKLNGFVLHHTVKNMADYAAKTVKYAMLNAEKYHQEGKKASLVMVVAAPAFAFVKYYFLKLGFLDGYKGWLCAKMTAWYTWLKYSRLKELQRRLKE
jgi:glycosyltransferase involved in cell wall biosynthesis